MDINRAVEILQVLGSGIDPATGEVLPNDSPYNAPDVIRAFHECANFIKNPPKKVRKTLEQKQAENLKAGMPRNAGTPWTIEMKMELAAAFQSGVRPAELAKLFERTRGAVVSELKKQGLIAEDELVSG